jgi:hypothetical protein
MNAGLVPKEDVLNLLNSPLVQFGTVSVLLGFAGIFDFTGEELFSPFDSREQIAIKIPLLAPRLASIEGTAVVRAFVNHSIESPIVQAVFSMAGRFEPSEVIGFFRKFQGIALWIALYESRSEPLQRTLRYFLADFPTRPSASKLLLSSDDTFPNLSVITELTDVSLFPFLTRRSNPLIDGFLSSKKLAKATDSNPSASIPGELPVVPESRPLLKIVSRSITTIERTITRIVFGIEPAGDGRPLFAVSLTVSNRDFFESDGEAMLPSVSGPC